MGNENVVRKTRSTILTVYIRRVEMSANLFFSHAPYTVYIHYLAFLLLVPFVSWSCHPLWCFARFSTFLQFKKYGKHPWRSVTFSKVAKLKVTLLHRCFACFLNCTNGTKSRKASHIILLFYKKQALSTNPHTNGISQS